MVLIGNHRLIPKGQVRPSAIPFPAFKPEENRILVKIQSVWERPSETERQFGVDTRLTCRVNPRFVTDIGLVMAMTVISLLTGYY